MSYRNLLEQRRKQLEKAESALDALSDPDIQAQLASDPEMRAAFMAAIGGSNGNAAPTGVAATLTLGHVTAKASMPPPGSLLRSVLDAAVQEDGDFTVATLVADMEDGGYRFAAADAKVAAGQALKDLSGRGFLQVVSLGKGRRATIYRCLKEDKQE